MTMAALRHAAVQRWMALRDDLQRRHFGRWHGLRVPAIVVPGGVRGRPQLVGAIGLTCTAPAAYYIGTGRLDERAFILWAANWIFAGNQIHFVQLRIRAARAATFSEKFNRGRFFFLAQPAFLLLLTFASLWRVLPPLVLIAFAPALVRGT